MNEEIGNQRLLISILYSSPYDRLATRAWGLDPRTLEVRHEIKEGGWRQRLATWLERKDFEWRERYVEAGILPPKRWRRRNS